MQIVTFLDVRSTLLILYNDVKGMRKTHISVYFLCQYFHSKMLKT